MQLRGGGLYRRIKLCVRDSLGLCFGLRRLCRHETHLSRMARHLFRRNHINEPDDATLPFYGFEYLLVIRRGSLESARSVARLAAAKLSPKTSASEIPASAAPWSG